MPPLLSVMSYTHRDNSLTCCISAEYAVLLCECMSAISGQQNVRLHSLIPDMLELLKKPLLEEGSHTLMVYFEFLQLLQCCDSATLRHTPINTVHNFITPTLSEDVYSGDHCG